MANGWDKVAQWAGIGNNRQDAAGERKEESMQDERNSAPEQETGAAQVETGSDAEQSQQQATHVGESSAELAQLTTERDGLRDRLARLQAEFDNARKREAKERQDAREYTIGSAVEPFLSVMDNFQLALKAQGSADQLRSGVELILKQMEDALKNMQVLPVESVGAQFDPRVHEALGSVETAEFPDHQVIEEIRRGYKLRERLLRPAMVRIAVNSAQVND